MAAFEEKLHSAIYSLMAVCNEWEDIEKNKRDSTHDVPFEDMIIRLVNLHEALKKQKEGSPC